MFEFNISHNLWSSKTLSITLTQMLPKFLCNIGTISSERPPIIFHWLYGEQYIFNLRIDTYFDLFT